MKGIMKGISWHERKHLGNFLSVEQYGVASASRARPRRPLIWCQRCICQSFWAYGCIVTLSSFGNGGSTKKFAATEPILPEERPVSSPIISRLFSFGHGGGRRVQTSSKLLLLGALKSILWSNTLCLSVGQRNETDKVILLDVDFEGSLGSDIFRYLLIRNKIRNMLFMQKCC